MSDYRFYIDTEDSCLGCPGNHKPYFDENQYIPVLTDSADGKLFGEQKIYGVHSYHPFCREEHTRSGRRCPCVSRALHEAGKELEKIQREKQRLEDEERFKREERKRELELEIQRKKREKIDKLKNSPKIPVWFTDKNGVKFKVNFPQIAIDKCEFIARQVANPARTKYEIPGNVSQENAINYMKHLIDPREFPYKSRNLEDIEFIQMMGDLETIGFVIEAYITECCKGSSVFSQKAKKFLQLNSPFAKYIWDNTDKESRLPICELMKAGRRKISFADKKWEDLSKYIDFISQ